MTRVLLAPTPEIRAACDRIDDAIGRLIAAVHQTTASYKDFGRYEADKEAVTLLLIALRSVEGVIELARHDLVLLPPAIMAARGAFETSLKAAWLVDCDDPYDRERRWLQHLASEERVWLRLVGHIEKAGGDSEWPKKRAADARAFREHVEKVFPEGYPALPGLPSVPEMVPTLHDEPLYVAYVYMSQFIHGERVAAQHYAPRDKPRVDAVEPNDWSMPLRVSWLSLFRAGRKIIGRLHGEPDTFMSEVEEVEVRNALAVVQ
ncbi:hypothetical protein [Phenylobacterium sp.]|uniref:hypothetical protein n=1 Tax=Phenylobacterium sp. TaxID=1871053 RepID=UPI002CBF7261|nr:hypothetical protein [Phenylobacterium sp.]HVI34581.1 hypothetical protein [Phenylobacterium sp.]